MGTAMGFQDIAQKNCLNYQKGGSVNKEGEVQETGAIPGEEMRDGSNRNAPRLSEKKTPQKGKKRKRLRGEIVLVKCEARLPLGGAEESLLSKFERSEGQGGRKGESSIEKK